MTFDRLMTFFIEMLAPCCVGAYGAFAHGVESFYQKLGVEAHCETEHLDQHVLTWETLLLWVTFFGNFAARLATVCHKTNMSAKKKDKSAFAIRWYSKAWVIN